MHAEECMLRDASRIAVITAYSEAFDTSDRSVSTLLLVPSGSEARQEGRLSWKHQIRRFWPSVSDRLLSAWKHQTLRWLWGERCGHTGLTNHRPPSLSNHPRWPPLVVVQSTVYGFCLNSSYGMASFTAIFICCEHQSLISRGP
jgi:hypothetical protein